MGSWRKGARRFGVLTLLIVVVAGCNGSKATPLPSVGQIPSGAHVGGFGVFGGGSAEPSANGSGPASSAGPRETSAPVTVDMITASYTYKDSLITPLAHLYGVFLDDFIIITVQNDNSVPVKVVATSEIDGYTTKASDTVTVDAGGTQEIRQNPRLTTTAIDGLNSAHQADAHVVVSYMDNGQARTVLDQTSTTDITSRRDFPLRGIDGFSQQDVYELLAVMVTPTDPAVAELIRAAAEYAPGKAMGAGAAEAATGGFDPNAVYAQLAAVWQAESDDYNLTYVSTTETFAAASQRIALPDEVLTNASGNCIELSLLFASVAESLGFAPYIILVPGHAYMAVQLDDNNTAVIETTSIGQATFDDTVKYGTKEWQEAEPHINAGDDGYGVLDVMQARKDGVTPIEWR
jgi:hypothetical protein